MVGLYLVLFAALISLALLLYLRNGLLYFPAYFFAYLALFHALIPAVLVLNFETYSKLLRPNLLVHINDQQLLVNLVFIITSAIGFSIGWLFASKVPSVVIRPLSYSQACDEGDRAILVAFTFLAIGLVGFVLYFSGFGGLGNAYAVARQVRSGVATFDGHLTFMRPVADLVKIAGILFFALYVAGLRQRRLLLGLIVALTASFMMLLFQGGRLGLALYFATLLAIHSFSHNEVSIFRMVVILLAVAILLFFGYDLLFLVYSTFSSEVDPIAVSSERPSIVSFFVSELSFPSLSLAVAQQAVNTGLVAPRLGVDFLLGIVSIIPARFYRVDMDYVGHIHTALYNPHGIGQIPVDLITYGLYSFGIFGPFVIAFLVAGAIKLIYRYCDGIAWPRYRFAFKVFITFLMARNLVYFDPAMAINSLFYVFVSFFVVYLISRRECVKGDRMRY